MRENSDTVTIETGNVTSQRLLTRSLCLCLCVREIEGEKYVGMCVCVCV